MQTSDTLKELAPALALLQAALPKVQKKGTNQHFKYSYAKLEDYIEAAGPVLEQHGFAIVTSAPTAESLEAKGMVRVTIHVRLLHKSGEWIEVSACGDGQDPGDKGIYKAMTGARKYGVACLLGLVTTDDPEHDTPKPKAPAKPKPKAPPSNGKAEVSLQELDSAIMKWTGFAAEDIIPARRQFIKSRGHAKLNKNLLAQLIGEANKLAEEKADFQEEVNNSGAEE